MLEFRRKKGKKRQRGMGNDRKWNERRERKWDEVEQHIGAGESTEEDAQENNF